jgi:hypothetical protein
MLEKYEHFSGDVFVERKLTMCRLFENVVTLSAMTEEKLELACVCNLVWRQTMDIRVVTHCIGSTVSKSVITNMAVIRNLEVIPFVSGLYLLQVLHKKYVTTAIQAFI